MSFEKNLLIKPIAHLNLYIEYTRTIKTNKYTTFEHISEQEFFTNLKDTDFSPITVGTPNGDLINTNIRSGKLYTATASQSNYIKLNYYNFACNRNYDENISGVKLNRGIIPFINKVLTPSIDDFKGKFIKYEVGDHFDTFHYDTFTNSNQKGTILLFPPNNINKFTGGELIFKNDNNEELVIKPNEFTEWTAVIFDKILHKCTPITSGIRYVLKYNLNAYIPGILNNKYSFNKIDIQELIQNYNKDNIISILQTEMKIIKIKISELFKQRQEIENDYFNSMLEGIESQSVNFNDKFDIDEENNNHHSYYLVKNFKDNNNSIISHKTLEDINDDINRNMTEYQYVSNKIKNINNDDDNNYQEDLEYICNTLQKATMPIIYCMETYYNNINEYSLKHLKIINELLNRNISVCEINKTFTKVDYHKSRYKSYNDYDDYDNERNNKDNTSYIWINKYFENGKVIDKYFEYNDESGDNIFTNYTVSCLIIFMT